MSGLNALIDIAKGTGAKVEFVDSISVLGRCDYINKVIYISSNEDYRKQVLILAHETGHWLTYLDNKRNKSLRRNEREKMAYERGWYLLTNLGLNLKYHITKEEWQDLNLHNYHNFDADAKEAWT